MKETIYRQDLANKKLFVTREFEGSLDVVWRAWTESDLLDQWWAPRPWIARTVHQDFRNGGDWLYYMQGPEGERHYCKADYSNINVEKSFDVVDYFCDEQGNPTPGLPSTHWTIQFNAIPTGTRVDMELTYASVEDLNKIVEMGFKEGFAMGHNNLDELLASMTAQA